MSTNNPKEKSPFEMPPKNVPHDPSPPADPDVSPNEDNPINPQEETPPSNQTR